MDYNWTVCFLYLDCRSYSANDSKVLCQYSMQQHRNVCFTAIARVEQNRAFTQSSWEILILESCADTFLRVYKLFSPSSKAFVVVWVFLFVLFRFKCWLIFRLSGSCPIALGLILLTRIGTRLHCVQGLWEAPQAEQLTQWDLQQFDEALAKNHSQRSLPGPVPRSLFPTPIFHVPPLTLFTLRHFQSFPSQRILALRAVISLGSGWWNTLFQPISSNSTACTQEGGNSPSEDPVC